MAIRTLKFFLLELSNNIRRNLLMTIASVSTVAILIFFFGMSLLLFVNFKTLRAALASEIEMHAYLKSDLTAGEAQDLARRAAGIPHVADVSYVSKEEAFERLKNDVRRDIDLSGILSNPLPAYLSIKVNDPESIPEVAREVQQMAGVDQINYLQKIIPSFISFFKNVQRALLGVVLFILACALLIIHNTIRLGVFSRKREIEIMKLVGASHGFICWPFVLEGIFYGWLGAVLAVLFLEPSYQALASRVAALFPIWPTVHGTEIGFLLASLPALGMLVGGSGSYFSVSRYLHF